MRNLLDMRNKLIGNPSAFFVGRKDTLIIVNEDQMSQLRESFTDENWEMQTQTRNIEVVVGNDEVKQVLSEIVNEESYTGEDCLKCGRNRVVLITLSTGNKYHICEKCRYIKEQDRYCDNSDFSYDLYYNNKTYLNEILVIKKE